MCISQSKLVMSCKMWSQVRSRDVIYTMEEVFVCSHRGSLGRTGWTHDELFGLKSQISSQYLEQFKLRVEFKEQLKFISSLYFEIDLKLSSDKNCPLHGNNRKGQGIFNRGMRLEF